jgi:glycosyltransferase involved in cell wall biosynthesis
VKDRSLHILFVLPSFAGGGAERVALTLAQGALERGQDVTIVVFDARGPLSSIVPDRAKLIDLARPRLRQAIPALIKQIRKTSPHVVFSTLGYVNVALLGLRFLLPRGVKVVVREANLPSLSLQNSRFSTLMSWAYRFLYPLADGVICTSRRMMGEMSEGYGVKAGKLSVLPNPVDESRLRELAMPIQRSSGAGVRLVSAGRFTHQKGFDLLLDMMASLPETFMLTVLGDGELRSTLEMQVRRLGLQSRVEFAGFVENPWPYYAGADCFVMPSRWEGLPNAALEALACGTPVVATPQSGGIREVAEVAGDGVVRVVNVGEPFVEVLQAVKPRSGHQNGLYPSLLPAVYRKNDVCDAFVHDIMSMYGGTYSQ